MEVSFSFNGFPVFIKWKKYCRKNSNNIFLLIIQSYVWNYCIFTWQCHACLILSWVIAEALEFCIVYLTNRRIYYFYNNLCYKFNTYQTYGKHYRKKRNYNIAWMEIITKKMRDRKIKKERKKSIKIYIHNNNLVNGMYIKHYTYISNITLML